jgi:hypothetical protein
MADEMSKSTREFGKRFANTVRDAMGDDQEVVMEFRREAQRRMQAIGMVQGTMLETAGTHLGSIIGGGIMLGIEAGWWPDALMKQFAGAELGPLMVDRNCAEHDGERKQYIRSIETIALACMSNVMLSVSVEAPDSNASMRAYLELLAEMVGGAMMAAEGD